jgi:hypothetical protein
MGRNGQTEADQSTQPGQKAALDGHSTLSPTPPLMSKRIPRMACEHKGDRGEGISAHPGNFPLGTEMQGGRGGGNIVCGAGIKNRLPI